MSPKVSILLPTHNKAGLLQFAIRSVLAQTFEDFEVLIVGDGCTDETADVIQSFKDNRLIWFDLPKAPNFGYANRNLALRKAKGELVAFMAHDDLWMNDHLENLIPVFADEKIEIAYSRPLWVNPDGFIVPGLFDLEDPSTFAFFMEKGNKIPAGCFVHRRECLDKYGYWDESLKSRGDWDMWKRIIQGGNGVNFAYINIPSCFHFKAGWHKKDYDLSHDFPIWEKLKKHGQLPEVMSLDISGHANEQEAAWVKLSHPASTWMRDLRSAVTHVTERLALAGLYSEPRSLEFQRLKKSLIRRLIERLRVFLIHSPTFTKRD